LNLEGSFFPPYPHAEQSPELGAKFNPRFAAAHSFKFDTAYRVILGTQKVLYVFFLLNLELLFWSVSLAINSPTINPEKFIPSILNLSP
jgi:hypothetical protein